jgi:hypothetical protein
MDGAAALTGDASACEADVGSAMAQRIATRGTLQVTNDRAV